MANYPIRKGLALALATVFLTLTACSENPQQAHNNLINQTDDLSNLRSYSRLLYDQSSIQVVDESNKPISNAKVLIGYALNQPFENNWLTTDQNGSFVIPSHWNETLPVTIEATGYIRTTYYHQSPNSTQLVIRQVDQQNKFSVTGKTLNFEKYIKEKDGIVDAAVVLPLMARKDLFFFNESTLMSTQLDYISVMGQKIGLPSNLSLPQQREKYSFFSFTLDKPQFKHMPTKPGMFHYLATRAKISVNALVDDRSVTNMVNNLQISGGGLRSVAVTGNHYVDIPVNEIEFNSKVSSHSYQFGKESIILSVALAKRANLYYFTDVKALDPNKSKMLNTQPNIQSELAYIWTVSHKDSSFKQVSALLTTPDKSQPFLSLIEKPNLQNEVIEVQKPHEVTNIRKAGMFVSLGEMKTINTGSSTEPLEVTTAKWEIFSPEWAQQLPLIQWPSGLNTLSFNKLEVTYFGSTHKAQPNRLVNITPIESVTHATRNSRDL